MARTEQMHIRVEPELKAEAEAVLAQLGMKATEFVRMALRQVVLQRGLPFAVRIPNAETVAALEAPTASLKRFDSAEALFADIRNRTDAGGREADAP